MITREMIRSGYEKGIVRIVSNPQTKDGLEPVCQIGEHWFYFAGAEGESEIPEEYVANVPIEDLIDEIYQALDGLTAFNSIEQMYYEAILRENGCAKNTDNTIKALSAWMYLTTALPREPYDENNNRRRFWTDGCMVLANTEARADAVADLIEEIDRVEAVTGFYDPRDDADSGEENEYTGWYYIDIC